MDELKIPNHVAIILDGNGRWAKERGKSRSEKLALIQQYFSQGYYITAEVKGATPGNQHWVAVTGIDSVNVMMVDPASSQTIMWNAYEVSKTSQFNYFKTN